MNRIKLLRKEHGDLQIDLADFLGVTSSALSYWESGKHKIPRDFLFKIADRYGVSIDYILGYSESRELAETNPIRLLREYLMEKTDREYSVDELVEIDEIITRIIKFRE